MAFLSWRSSYELGVTQIDTEHRFLFALINEFHDTHKAGGSRGDVLQVLTRLIAYAEVHFQHEQGLMTAEAYPRIEHHIGAHDGLVRSIFKLNDSLESGVANVDAKALQFLKLWLTEHIVQEDLDFADFLRGKALKAARERIAAAAPVKSAATTAAPDATVAATDAGKDAEAAPK